MKIGIVVVAAGRGERAGSPEQGPKQYRMIGGSPVITHTLKAFLSWRAKVDIGPIVVVIHPDDRDLFSAASEGLNGADRLMTTTGGATRQHSVLAGLTALRSSGVTHVMIHDAARPFVEHALLHSVVELLSEGAQAVLPALAISDTLKRADASGYIRETVPRADLYGAQTPQAFEFDQIIAAHQAAADSNRTDFTDDASIAEWAGIPVRLTPGSASNIKLTTAQDILMADAKLNNQPVIPDVRTGNGYDVHQLVPGDGVTLCGVFIPHDLKLSGHSDADVALHALTDALLATCGAGDIGDHFPPSDPQWKGAASRIFLAHAAEIVRSRGGIITNADISLIAEVPKVAPHRDAMRANMAEILSISLDRCSVKATTNEKIGFIGRKEGIAAIATATVVYGVASL